MKGKDNRGLSNTVPGNDTRKDDESYKLSLKKSIPQSLRDSLAAETSVKVTKRQKKI